MLFATAFLMALTLFGGKGEVSAADKTTRIYDGTSAAIEDFPFVVGILKNGTFKCAGVIISESWVMALGDCVYLMTEQSLMRIVAGSDSVTTGTSYSVHATVKCPDFNHDFQQFSDDFYLIQIDGTFSWSATVGRASLPSKEPSAGTEVVAVGFADPTVGGLRQGTMKWQSDEDCRKTYEGAVVSYGPSMACAYNKGKVTLCKRDEGDAFVKDGVLYGFFSKATKDGMCTSSAKPVLLANIAPAVSWIKKITGI